MIRWIKKRRAQRRLEKYRTARRVERRHEQVADLKHLRCICVRLLRCWDSPEALSHVVAAIDSLDEALRVLEPDGYRPDLVEIPRLGVQ